MRKPALFGGTSWLPLLVGVLLGVIVLLVALKLYADEELERERLVQAHAQRFLDDIEADLISRIPAVRRLVDRWVIRGGTPEKEFVADVQNYMNDYVGFQGLGWADADFIIRWAVPLYANSKAVGFDLKGDDKRAESLEKAKASKLPTMSEPIVLLTGDTGLHLDFPIYVNGDFQGFILAVLHTEKWMSNVLRVNEERDHLDEVFISVRQTGDVVFRQKGWDASGEEYAATAKKMIMGRMFSVTCHPTKTFFEQTSNLLPFVTAGIGLLFAALVSFVIYYFQKASEQAWENYASTLALEQQVLNREKAEQSLIRMTDRLTLATKAGGVGVWEWDIDTGYLTWDDMMFELYDIPPDVIPKYETWKSAVHPDDVGETSELLIAAVNGEASFDTEFRIVLSNGSLRYLKAAARVERDADGKPMRMTGVNWDITERVLSEERVRHLATHDTLTDLPTLRLAKDRIAMALESARRKDALSAVLFVDLDGFKKVNDSIGHDAGDVVLKETAQRLLGCVRKVDTVARIGGDEFLVVLSELTSVDGAEHVANKIVESIATPYVFGEHSMTVGASVGVAICSGDCEARDVEGLIKKADQAMYTIKKSGKNGFAFAESPTDITR